MQKEKQIFSTLFKINFGQSMLVLSQKKKANPIKTPLFKSIWLNAMEFFVQIK